MQTNLDDVRRHFSSLSDEGLLEVNREDLADAAKQCYDQEIASRGFDEPPADGGEIEEPEDLRPELVSIAKFEREDQANFARGLLEAHEIESYLTSDPMFPGKLPVACCTELMVAPEFADEAREVLETSISDEELAAQAEAEDEPQ